MLMRDKLIGELTKAFPHAKIVTYKDVTLDQLMVALTYKHMTTTFIPDKTLLDMDYNEADMAAIIEIVKNMEPSVNATYDEPIREESRSI